MTAIASPRPELGTRAASRTHEIERCLKMQPHFIFMMDLDQTMPDEALSLMLQKMDNEKLDIALIDAPHKDIETSTNIAYHPDGSFAYGSISCCLIRSEVFSQIKKPWFSSEYAYVELGHKDGKIVWRVDKKYQDDNIGEDVYFIRKCIESGIKIGVVTGLRCRHFHLEAR